MSGSMTSRHIHLRLEVGISVYVQVMLFVGSMADYTVNPWGPQADQTRPAVQDCAEVLYGGL